MLPIYYTLQNGIRLMIIPDTQAHLNGHAVITFTYSIYADRQDGKPYPPIRKEDTLHLSDNPDPDYYGFIAFEKPGSLFTYTADGKRQLTSDESTELIEHLSHIRDDGSWKNSHSDNSSNSI